jgi:hypothetical protein
MVGRAARTGQHQRGPQPRAKIGQGLGIVRHEPCHGRAGLGRFAMHPGGGAAAPVSGELEA